MTAKRSTSEVGAPVLALSATLMAIGLLAIVFFALTVANDPAIQFVRDWTPTEGETQPSLLLVFLERFGIIVSTLFIGAGAFFFAIGWRLRQGHIRIAFWARILLLWLAIGVAAYIALTVFNILNNAAMDRQTVYVGALLGAIAPALLVFAVAASLWYWLNNNLESLFAGDDSLLGQETRLAWNLLIPTLTIFVLVAARPLEQTFIRSLTDKRFAGSAVPQFVGLENYYNLLTIRVDTVSCRKSDPDDPCSTRANGSIRWESIDRELLREGYRTVTNIAIGNDQSLAISGLDDDFIDGVWTTVIFTIISVALELLIGLFMALVVNSKFRGRGGDARRDAGALGHPDRDLRALVGVDAEGHQRRHLQQNIAGPGRHRRAAGLAGRSRIADSHRHYRGCLEDCALHGAAAAGGFAGHPQRLVRSGVGGWR